MNFVIFASLMLLAGYSMVNGNSLCLQEKLRVCFTKVQSNGMPTLRDICNSLADVVECINTALEQCEVEDPEDMNDILAAAQELCKPGSELNQKLTSQKYCLASVVSSEIPTCIADTLTALENLPQPLAEDVVSQAIIIMCGYFHDVVTCLYNATEAYCTKEGREVLSAIGDPALNMVEKDCKVIADSIYEYDSAEGASAASTFSWTVFTSAALLLALWTLNEPHHSRRMTWF